MREKQDNSLFNYFYYQFRKNNVLNSFLPLPKLTSLTWDFACLGEADNLSLPAKMDKKEIKLKMEYRFHFSRNNRLQEKRTKRTEQRANIHLWIQGEGGGEEGKTLSCENEKVEKSH